VTEPLREDNSFEKFSEASAGKS